MPLCSERSSCRLVGWSRSCEGSECWMLLAEGSVRPERKMPRKEPAPAGKGTRLQEVSSRDGNGVSQTLRHFYLSHSQSTPFALRAELLAGAKATSLRWPAGSSQRGEAASAPGKSSGGCTRRALAGSRAVETNPLPTPGEESVPQRVTQRPARRLGLNPVSAWTSVFQQIRPKQ